MKSTDLANYVQQATKFASVLKDCRISRMKFEQYQSRTKFGDDCLSTIEELSGLLNHLKNVSGPHS